ncbi:MAG: D-sedoheptulose 7-phosphate isomerase [Bacteroidales bacterium]|nr:D-sedoheptulose 7-phosphate isomerase [Bacteroidales bacterium]
MQLIKNNFIEAKNLLDEFISNQDNFLIVEKAAKELVLAINNGKKIFSCGNGGSMADAMHFAEELTGRFRNDRKPIPAISISDPTHMSCTANDYGYDQIFSRYLNALGNKGDILLAISTSGNSQNIINACEVAKNKGIKVIALTGKDGGKLAKICDIEIRAPFSEYADRVQEIHIKIIHSLIHYLEKNLKK